MSEKQRKHKVTHPVRDVVRLSIQHHNQCPMRSYPQVFNTTNDTVRSPESDFLSDNIPSREQEICACKPQIESAASLSSNGNENSNEGIQPVLVSSMNVEAHLKNKTSAHKPVEMRSIVTETGKLSHKHHSNHVNNEIKGRFRSIQDRDRWSLISSSTNLCRESRHGADMSLIDLSKSINMKRTAWTFPVEDDSFFQDIENTLGPDYLYDSETFDLNNLHWHEV